MFDSILYVLFYLFIQMIAVWFLYLKTNNPSIVDMTWPIGLVISGLIYLFKYPFSFRLCIISSLLLVWGFRLSFYLWFSRIRLGHVDKRYLELSDSWKIKKSLGFLMNFQLQGLLIFILASVFWFAAQNAVQNLSDLDLFACALVIVGILGETVADLQLQHFKANYKGLVCDQGLWKFSRHPNYFFEWLVWCGFSVFALQKPYGYFGLISPVILFFIFTQITGPLTERSSIKARGQAYLDYQKHTNFFFPGIKK